MGNPARSKRDRERAKQEKAAQKRARRQGGGTPDDTADTIFDGAATAPDGPRRSQDEVLADLAQLHRRFDDEQIGFDEFESAKAALLAQLAVD
jgi:hypothetical protein